MSVKARFETFLENIALTPDQVTKGGERRESVVGTLNWNYWSSTNRTANSVFVGSWAKLTRIRPPRDVDILFSLPRAVYDRYQLRLGNKQSQLLQEVRNVLSAAYPNTAIRGDGPVVVVPFTAFNVEVIPAFALEGGGHWVCMTDSGGHYKKADYAAEATNISTSNTNTSGNTRELVRMMKCWQSECSVPIKSFHIELMAVTFLNGWEHRGKGKLYYDWMVRDFLQYMVNNVGGWVFAPGTSEGMSVGSGWESKAKSALERAKKACSYESNSHWSSAGDEWQKIFGTYIPKYP
jgi:hypothetical protein